MDNNKLWKGNKKTANLRISLYGRQNGIQVGKDVLRVLGAPSFISLRINREMDSLVIEPSQEKAQLSFKVPEGIMMDKHKQMIVNSASFVTSLMNMNGMDISNTYQVMGTYSEKNNAVVFSLKNWKLLEPKSRQHKN